MLELEMQDVRSVAHVYSNSQRIEMDKQKK